MVETQRTSSEQGYWGYLIKSDKSASPHLEQLCLSLAELICNLESGPPNRLTPRRLATFYKSVGGDLDALFLRTSESGLSFLYRTIGCFHSLEPTSNPFETPALPCLTPEGFVKWQTVQLLLCPDEHMRYLQEAVKVYNVPRPDGGFFPKSIPNEAFPSFPDVEMEQWHKRVTSQLHQENHMRVRLKNSPYASPLPTDRADGYFSPSIPRIRRPSKPSRQDSRDEEHYHRPNSSRRSSEPDWTFHMNSGENARTPHMYVRDGDRRSVSANRPGVGPRQRSATTGHPVRPNPSNTSSRNSDRPPSSFYRGQYPDKRSRSSRRSPSISSGGDSSAEDASSEDSRGQRKSRASKAASSLLSVLPFTTPWNKRSRSHDASYRKDRPLKRDDQDTPPPLRASTENFQRPSPTVRFRQDIFENPAAASAPESPVYDRRPHSGHRPDLRYQRNPAGPGLTDPVSPVGYHLTKEMSSGSGSEHRSVYEIPVRQQRKSGLPQRTTTVTGVHGRKYASVQQGREASVPSSMPPDPAQQDPRNQMRYSLAV